MTPIGIVAALVPLLPDGDEAREWAERELSDPAYAAAEPTVIDRAARAVADFLSDLFSPSAPTEWGPSVLVVLGVLLAAAVVVGILIWGRPRATVRTRTGAGALFDGDDARSADDLRRDAVAAADRSDWDEAIVLRFRALARGLGERGIVDPPPGATAHAFARETARALPELTTAVDGAAAIFDDVRYLRRPGTAPRYRAVVELDDAAVRARPATRDAAGAAS